LSKNSDYVWCVERILFVGHGGNRGGCWSRCD